MAKATRTVVTAFLWVWLAPSAMAQTTGLLFNSQAGDYIGQGQKWSLWPSDGTFTATRVNNGVQISFNGSTFWTLTFVAPDNATLTPGTYEGAQRYPFQSPANPGLNISGSGRACNSLTGRFVVLEANYASDGSVSSFAADYEQHCEGGAPALLGSVRLNFIPTPTQISMHAGNLQIASVGKPVKIPPTVLVQDASGFPVQGVEVAFAVTAGGGSVAESATTTNVLGLATPGVWTLGAVMGVNNNSLSASAPGLGGSPIAFIASAGAAAPPSLLDGGVTQLSAGRAHTCGLTTGGGVRCWGDGSNGQLGKSAGNYTAVALDVPGLASGVVSVVAGDFHTCALTTAGGVKCWGRDFDGQLGDGAPGGFRTSPGDALGLTSGVVALGAGERHTCALTAAGGVLCWGFNGEGALGDGSTTSRATPTPVVGLDRGVRAIAAGGLNTCAITTAGGAKCWGRNNHGQVGDGSQSNRLVPADVSGLSSGTEQISAGASHTCAIVSGSVKCWGYNAYGNVGDGSTTTRTVPVNVAGLSAGAVSISSGGSHTCAKTSLGILKCWGRNLDGQLGDGTQTDKHAPVYAHGLPGPVDSVTGGHAHTCAVTVEGGAMCVGLNANGQLGGDMMNYRRTTSTDVLRLAAGVASVSSGLYHSCGLTTAGAVKCWGNNYDGELGDGTTTDRTEPVSLTNVALTAKGLGVGAYHSCALRPYGDVMCWGYNGTAALGDGTTTSSSVPVSTLGVGIAVQIAAGRYHTCALSYGGSVQCWGYNSNGQLGDGTTFSRLTPVWVLGLQDVTHITAGDFHTCALTKAGGVKCWGSNLNGKLGDGTVTQRASPIDVQLLGGAVRAVSAGAQHTCAVLTSGTVRCWGDNSGGQLGDGTTSQASLPVNVSGLTNAASVATGRFHTCAVTTGAGLKCWGWNGDGQLGDGTIVQRLLPVDVVGLSASAASVSTGAYHTCAVTIGGGLMCWGYNGYGALADGTTLDRRSPGAVRFGQSITFTPPSLLNGVEPKTLVASSSNGLAVTFDTWTPKTCSIAGNSIVPRGSALCAIRVSQAGDNRNAAAPQRIHVLSTPSTLFISDLNVIEGASGATTANFSVELSGHSTIPVSASFATADLNASAPADYIGLTGTLTFSPGEVSKTISIDILGDTSPESIEYFKVTLSAITGAIPGDIEALGAIIDDDNLDPTLINVSSVSGPEGYTGGSTLFFPVRLSRPAIAPVTVNYQTTAGTAATSLDFTATSGQLAFAIGDVQKMIAVPIIGDAASEPNESFTLTLSSPSGAAFSPGGDEATGTILNDDLSTISVTDYTIVEGTTGTPSKLAFTVILSATSNSTVTVNYATADGTATAGSDYTHTSGTLSIPPGVASLVVQVPVTQDAVIEPNETVLLNLSNASGATIFDAQGVGTIQADDGLLVSIADKTTAEGNTGFTPVTFTVSLSAPAPGAVTVDYATADGTATDPLDYTATTGTLSFAAGEQTKTVTVQVVGETGEEAYETFFVDLSNPTGGANIGDGRGQGTITNTDGSTDRSRLMFHNFVTNRLYRWHMKNGNTLDTFNWVTPWATDPGWTVGAVADFDQDGQLDYLWHNVNDGRLLFWYIDGDNLKGFQFLPYTMGPPWRVATTFDADGNGTPDIVYYNSTTGVVRVMRHDNGTLLGQYDIAVVLPGSGTVRIVASVDADNDGDDELALYNSATGQVAAWNLTGATLTSTFAYVNTQSTTQAYNLVSTKTDFNDDGLADFLWHNPTPTGVFSVWFMNGTTRLGVGQFQPFSATDPVWRVVGSANVW